jgi:hypothetical protein
MWEILFSHCDPQVRGGSAMCESMAGWKIP